MLLDDLMPRYDVAAVHRIAVAASPDRALAAMLEVAPGEMPLVRLLFALRWLPSLLRGRPVLNVPTTPLHAQMLASGFVLLAEEPHREVVIGFVGRPWRLGSPTIAIADAEEFAVFARPGFVKGAGNISVEAVDGGAVLRTETRVLPTDPAARHGFGRYWRVIRLGSAAIRREWLRAAKRRAEGDVGSAAPSSHVPTPPSSGAVTAAGPGRKRPARRTQHAPRDQSRVAERRRRGNSKTRAGWATPTDRGDTLRSRTPTADRMEQPTGQTPTLRSGNTPSSSRSLTGCSASATPPRTRSKKPSSAGTGPWPTALGSATRANS